MRSPKLGKVLYECQRCGDNFDCATEDEVFLASTHRLLHIAGDWKQSLRPAVWPIDEDQSATPLATNTP